MNLSPNLLSPGHYIQDIQKREMWLPN